MQGRRALQVEFDEGPNATLTAAGIRETLVNLTMKPGGGVAEQPRRCRPGAVRSSASRSRRRTKRRTSHTRGWSRTRASRRSRTASARSGRERRFRARRTAPPCRRRGCKPDQVQVHTTYMGGSYGSRGGGAFVAEAVEVAKAVGVPVKLTYSTRRRAAARPLSPGVRACGSWRRATRKAGRTAWSARIACPTWMGLRNGVARESVEGIADYDIPNIQVEYHDPESADPDRLLAIGRTLAEHVLRGELPRRNGRRRPEGSGRNPPADCTRSRRGCSAC